MSDVVSRGEIRRAARRVGIDEDIFERLIATESAGRKRVVSPAGAIGPGQLMPATAQELGVDPHDPGQNLEGAARYLRDQLRRFGGDYRLALAAYNAGPGAVEQHGGVPPFAETQAYVQKILGDRELVESPEVRRAGRGDGNQQRARAGAGDQGVGRAAMAAQLLDGESDALDIVLAGREAEAAAQQAVGDEGAERPARPRDRAISARARDVQSLGGEVDELLMELGAPLGSGVRDREENAAAGGAEDSDHLPEPDRWARDVKVTGRKAEAVGRRVAKALGARFVVGEISNSTIRHGRKSYRVQMILGTADHDDHLHIGIRALD